jgi:predicted small metal-binding protein
MSYKFACKDLGMDCGFKAEAKTKDKLMEKIYNHAVGDHNMTEKQAKDPNMIKKVQAAIKAS